MFQQSCRLTNACIGAGESGKSTILKQMRLIHTEGFQEHERKEVRQVIFSNMVVAFKIIAEEMRDLGLKYENEDSEVSGVLYSTICRSFQTSPINVGPEMRSNPISSRGHWSQRFISNRVPRCYERTMERCIRPANNKERERICAPRQHPIV
jgi:hypothetical protein